MCRVGTAWGARGDKPPPGFFPRGPNTEPRDVLFLPRNNCKKDAVTIALVNSMTSLYAAIIVFSVLGFKAANDHGRCLDR